VESSNHKGAVAEAAIAYEATKLGVEVLKPQSDHCRYDLVFDIAGRLYRVQCKTAQRRGEVVVINLVSSWPTANGYIHNKYEPGEVDFIAAHFHESGSNFLLPFDFVSGMSAIQLRLSPPKNAQRAAVHFAADHQLSGAIAQLGERVHGMHEVAGSSPAGSTVAETGLTRVAANPFRAHFGYWMQRAAAGEEIVITRRGKRFARLGPADPPLPLDEGSVSRRASASSAPRAARS
jgi:prevent-host-death family protein